MGSNLSLTGTSGSPVSITTYQDSAGNTSAGHVLHYVLNGVAVPISAAAPAPVTATISSLPALPTGSNVIGAVTQSGGPWSVTGSLSATTTGAYNSTLPTYTSGQTTTLQTDSNGRLLIGNFPATQPVSGTVAVSGTVPVSGTFYQATQPVSLTTLPALTAGSATIGAVTQASGPWTVSWSGQTVAATQSGTWNIGSITTLPALPAGSNIIGAVTQSGTWNVADSSVVAQIAASAVTQPSSVASVASSSLEASHVLKAAAGKLQRLVVVNSTSTAGFVCVLNATSAPSSGTGISPVWVDRLPASGSVEIQFGEWAPLSFSTGCTVVVTSNASPFTFTSGTITAYIAGLVV